MVINIKLLDNWRIKSDKHNIILLREEGNREIAEGYYSSLKGAIESFAEKKIKGFNSTNINSLVLAIKSLTTRLNTLLAPLELEVISKKQVKNEDKKE